MEVSQVSQSITIEVIPAAAEQEPILANLLELYIHDFSELLELKPGADGRFGYQQLSLYWKEAGRYPFLIRVDSHWAGFAFVRRGSQISDDENVWDMAEFFILRGSRRLGVGRRAAYEVWQRFPGAWEVRVMNRNQRAMNFWRRATTEFTGKMTEPIPFNKNGEGWHVFSFESDK